MNFHRAQSSIVPHQTISAIRLKLLCVAAIVLVLAPEIALARHSSPKTVALPVGLAQAIQAALGLDEAGQLVQRQELPGPGASGFGLSVALSGDGHVALIGAPYENSNTGVSYIFTEDHDFWTEQQELTASDSAPGNFFGWSVALSGNGRVALIGSADNFGTGAGTAYIFTKERDAYTQRQELTGSDTVPGDEFGWSVALSNDGHFALVGAIGGNSGRGVVYFFRGARRAYTQQQELTPSDAALYDSFGSSIALDRDGHIVLIGAIGGNHGAGSAYVFIQDDGTYTQQQQLIASDAAQRQQFGNSLALSSDGHIALIGAPYEAIGTGRAYVFAEDDDTYTQQQELAPSDGAPGDGFGSSVALSGRGRLALIGEPLKNAETGAAYVFIEDDKIYTQTQELITSPATEEASFAGSVALDRKAETALIGAPSFGFFVTPAAYVFTMPRRDQ